MSFTVVIPARYASTRLPGKPLLEIGGKTMIQHVYERACESEASRVIVATDDDRIAEAAREFGAEVMMTAEDHASGTDRLEEVARALNFAPDDRIVNVQGDEPLIPPALINQVARNLEQYPQAKIATLCEEVQAPELIFNPNVVKVVRAKDNFALYFSRAPIPWARNDWSETTAIPERLLPAGMGYLRHIGIYAYRVGLLHDFVGWQASPLEKTESLEQLRALENGARIHVDIAVQRPLNGIDTPEDLEHVRRIFADGLEEVEVDA
ncbi:3-deoxy-manno-octulosonate cytidylyltransferase [Marinobacter fonticola]|uniref:3-deoxy-manno-octulosonate cytidylyltransferase n=1 Tax=Marinobacter fonticola TaxID=2603215 RepID=UPI0011E6702A|nr:3-deoxy-manno-octulosonate cytidylyltransferase [Marinobacter fonticola]